MIDNKFWIEKRVFLTGHTGFKGSWLSIWLNLLGAKVTGYALDPPTDPSLFIKANVKDLLDHNTGDIRDFEKLKSVMIKADPEIVIHMAAQPLVRESYIDPVGTYYTNVMGTVHLLESIRSCLNVRSIVNVTTDKCYENKEWVWGYRENEPMGGYDPYSNSKGCSELVTSSYRSSFFNSQEYGIKHHVSLATARAGNVIGGGDWAKDRIVPDTIDNLKNSKQVTIRNPNAIRPWQNVLEPLSGYILLAQKLFYDEGLRYSQAWNFGPNDDDVKTVGYITQKLIDLWGGGTNIYFDKSEQPHEANFLKLDISKAKSCLGWKPRTNLDYTLNSIVEWHKNINNLNIRELCIQQIQNFNLMS